VDHVEEADLKKVGISRNFFWSRILTWVIIHEKRLNGHRKFLQSLDLIGIQVLAQGEILRPLKIFKVFPFLVCSENLQFLKIL